MRLWLVACAALAAGAPAVAQQVSVKAGIEAWQREEYEEAVATWRPLAEKGDADAAFNLGQAYRLGRGVPLNLAAAQSWLERAARKDHLDAQATLGLLLFQNGNRAGALRWLRSAADKGEPRAMLMYGTALYNGDGVGRDPVLAYAFVSRAAAQGLAPAKSTLEDMDKAMPIDQRRRGVAVARQKAAEARLQARSTVAPPKPEKAEPPGKVAAADVPKPSPPARSAAPKAPVASGSGPWRIQLGAFGQRASADALFKRVSAIAALSGKRAFLVPAGKMTRLQVGPFPTRAAATSACAALKGQPCFPVAAN